MSQEVFQFSAFEESVLLKSRPTSQKSMFFISQKQPYSRLDVNPS